MTYSPARVGSDYPLWRTPTMGTTAQAQGLARMPRLQAGSVRVAPARDDSTPEAERVQAVGIVIVTSRPMSGAGFCLWVHGRFPGWAARTVIAGDDFVERIGLPPDLVVTTVCGDCRQLLPEIRAAFPAVPILVLVDRFDAGLEADLVLAGAKGVLVVSSPEIEVVAAVANLLQGGTQVPAAACEALVDASRSKGLPDRQRLVLELMAKGLANKQIASEMQFSVSSVKTHIARLMLRFEMGSRTELVANARELLSGDADARTSTDAPGGP